MSGDCDLSFRVKTPYRCSDCGSFLHNGRACPAPDRDLADQIRADEETAIKEVVIVLASRVQRERWPRILLQAYRRALTEEAQALYRELSADFKDVIDAAPSGSRSR